MVTTFKTIGWSSTIIAISCQGLWLLIIEHHYNHLLIGMRSIIIDNNWLCRSRCSPYNRNVQRCMSQVIKIVHRRLINNSQNDLKPTVKTIDRCDHWSIIVVDRVKLASNCCHFFQVDEIEWLKITHTYSKPIPMSQTPTHWGNRIESTLIFISKSASFRQY